MAFNLGDLLGINRVSDDERALQNEVAACEGNYKKIRKVLKKYKNKLPSKTIEGYNAASEAHRIKGYSMEDGSKPTDMDGWYIHDDE